MPSTLVQGAHIEFNSIPLSKSSVFNWDQINPQWEASRGTPDEWAPVGLSIIAINPVDPGGNNMLVVDGISVTPILVNSGDFVDIGQEDFAPLMDYVQHLAVFKEGGAEFESSLPLYKSFIAAAGVRNEKFRASALYRLTMGLDDDQQLKPFRRKRQMQPVGAH